MIGAPQQAGRPRVHLLDAIDGVTVPVTVAGPATGRTIIMLDDPMRDGTYDAVRERLRVATFQTVVVSAPDGLTPKAVVSVLEQLKVSGGLLFGDGAAGALAWGVAATHSERFTGLVVVNCGHPSVPDIGGEIADNNCPAAQVDTTVLVSTAAAHAVGLASRRMVQGDFRLVDLAGPRASRHFTTQLVTEIVLRALSR